MEQRALQLLVALHQRGDAGQLALDLNEILAFGQCDVEQGARIPRCRRTPGWSSRLPQLRGSDRRAATDPRE